MRNPLPTRLTRLCKVLSYASLFGMVGLLAMFVFIVFVPSEIVTNIPASGTLTPIKHAMFAVLFGIGLIPAFYALLNLTRLFSAYAEGRVFSEEIGGYIRNLGIALIASTLLGVLIATLNTLVLTYDNPPGSRSISLGLSSNDYQFVLLGCLFLVIGWVMKEATRQADELGAFV